MKYDNLFSLQGKIAVVTGGSGYIGEELVRSLAEFKATVLLADINQKEGEGVANQLTDSGLSVTYRHLDITNQKSVSDLINFMEKKYKRIDIWVNNAYPRTNDWGKKFEEVSLASWKKNIDMHLSGYFICSQKSAEHMKKQRGGSIINLASIYGILAPDFSIYKNTDMTMPAAYSAIKSGIINFTRYLASYYGKYNIRINCVSPGGIYNRQPYSFVKRYTQKTLLKRMGHPEDIAGAVIYLASDAAKYVTGHNLIIDGGLSII